MSQNVLQLDQDKTEVLIIHSKARMENLASKHEAQGLNPSQEARNLGVIFDSDLKHMYTVSPKQFFFLSFEKSYQNEAISLSEQQRHH